MDNKKEKKIIIKKPSHYFFISLFISFVLLSIIGIPIWRHIDDFGPLEVLYEADSFSEYFKLFSYWGWGSYPPIWEYFSFSSYIFNPFGLDFVRSICFILGFISIGLSSILTYTICSLVSNQTLKKNNSKSFEYPLEICSVLFNCLNPEIILHSNSNMPYNLSTITFQIVFILILNFVQNEGSFITKKSYILIESNTLYLLVIFCFLLTFQSTIIICALFLTFLFYCLDFKVKIKFRNIINPIFLVNSYFKLFNHIKNKYLKYLLILSLSYFLIMYGLKLMVIIFYKNMVPGSWANGLGEIYNISLKLNNISEIINKVFFNFGSIITQSLYPFRNGQIRVIIFLSIFFAFCFIKINKNNLLSKYFSIYSISTIIITLFLSIVGNFIFSPTRHTIYLYPIVWIPVIITLRNLISNLKIINIFLLIVLYFTMYFGCYLSIRQISYTKNEKIELINLLKKADFNFNKSYESFSNISLHGSEEFELTESKKCSADKIKNLNSFKLFLYSHRQPFYNNQNQLENLSKSNKECFKKNFKVSILEKIEKSNKKDIEQNNLIHNGGSNLYAYLVKVSIN